MPDLGQVPQLDPGIMAPAFVLVLAVVSVQGVNRDDQVRHATCTSPVCRRPASQCDFEHNTPYEAGGRTCLCNGGPKCRHDHRLKQHPKWKVDQLPGGTFRWTTPSGRSYDTEPTRYPI